ncbi:FAD-dependent oxidoreductase [Streptomyces sp. NPDC056492]|uniref:FAD-dependent oxidoreductase n=1 Tax=unclassified Streptomyces TaxID=2593676 RepID=UPI00367DD891
MSTSTPPRIAIIGAGPGGLTCARILQRHGVLATVYDRDASPSARDQGGTLDMHPGSGRKALREAGLLDEFTALARPEGRQMRLVGRDGQVLFDAAPPAADGEVDGEVEGEVDGGAGAVDGNPEIDRGQLRDLLLNSLHPGTVRWSHKLAHVEPLTVGVHRLHFADGATADADLVIGADGAWSTVRRRLSGAAPSTPASRSSRPASTTPTPVTPHSPRSPETAPCWPSTTTGASSPSATATGTYACTSACAPARTGTGTPAST